MPPSAENTILAPALSTIFAGETEIDQPLVDEAVRYINAFKRGKELEAVSGIGEYVVATFFGGDFRHYHDR